MKTITIYTSEDFENKLEELFDLCKSKGLVYDDVISNNEKLSELMEIHTNVMAGEYEEKDVFTPDFCKNFCKVIDEVIESIK